MFSKDLGLVVRPVQGGWGWALKLGGEERI